ncbi:1-acyl-sn-glycerol-3-phosphate acyltransferase 1, chloroplastic [Vitis vinifera]|uniref:1-acyl-sn-glycerol-3-phosphate acyltransferase 1, chloroplastic n=1 Tax=Vitis vinifera TaxID=29760 RepID=A0A438IHA0_VITVI|nr:1-acyl-sn-glycerol-3-phosphate acyltransferase 1, chloroplastic [Vitis vinifera]
MIPTSVAMLHYSKLSTIHHLFCYSCKIEFFSDLFTLFLSSTVALNSILCTPKKYSGVSQHYFNPKVEFDSPYVDNKLQNWNKFSRNIVVRSELAETGYPDAGYPLSDLQLSSKFRGICFYAVTAFAAIFYTPAVYVSNHQSFLDIYTLLTLGRSFKFISKTGIFLFPIIGWAMFMMGTIPLKRMDSRSQLDCLKRCMDLIKKGASVFFFPEGTRSKDGKLGSFKKGAFSIAVKTRVPVVPIVLIGTGKIMPPGMEGIVNPGSVKVVIHKPIEGNDAEVLCNEARNIIADVLNQKG